MTMSKPHRRLQAVILACGLAALQLGGCATPATKMGAIEKGGDVATQEGLGIKILDLRRTSAGYMIDLRYTVVDPEKAAPILDRMAHPYLLDQITGARLFVPDTPTLGSLRQTPGQSVAGHRYFVLFANPGKHVEAGRKVTLVVGALRVPNLTVQE